MDSPAKAPVKISIEHVYKIFGHDPPSVLERVKGGASKQEILETGHIVALRDVSFDVRDGETFVVMGLSGSGKSTLIRHINRLIDPTAGRILVDGEDILGRDENELRELRRHKISMVFQRFALLPHKTVIENVAYGLKIRGMARKAALEAAREQINLVGLSGFEERYPSQLSGGMQQRVGLARALATDAEILLMDEAFSALDPLIRNEMQEQLKELQQRLRKTIVFITHDLDEALRLGDRIAILKDGELRQSGTVEEILLKPADDYVARFVRDVNRARVVTLNRIAEPFPSVALSQCSAQGLSRHFAGPNALPLIVLDEAGRPAGGVSRSHFETHRDEPDRWWRTPGNLMPLKRADGSAPVESVLADLSEGDLPVAIIDGDNDYVGAVSRQTAIRALAKEAPDPKPEVESGRRDVSEPARTSNHRAQAPAA